MPAENLPEGERLKMASRLNVEIFPEGEPFEVVQADDAVKVGIFIRHAQDRRGREDNLQPRNFMVTLPKLLRPPGVFVDLIEKEHPTTQLRKLIGKGKKPPAREVKIVEIDVHHRPVVSMGGPDVVEQKSGLPHPPEPLDANQTLLPVDPLGQPARKMGTTRFQQ